MEPHNTLHNTFFGLPTIRDPEAALLFLGESLSDAEAYRARPPEAIPGTSDPMGAAAAIAAVATVLLAAKEIGLGSHPAMAGIMSKTNDLAAWLILALSGAVHRGQDGTTNSDQPVVPEAECVVPEAE